MNLSRSVGMRICSNENRETDKYPYRDCLTLGFSYPTRLVWARSKARVRFAKTPLLRFLALQSQKLADSRREPALPSRLISHQSVGLLTTESYRA